MPLFHVSELNCPKIYRNPSPALLYEHSLRNEEKSLLTNTGALAAYSGKKTGRSPTDKRIVDEPSSSKNIDWNNFNIKTNRESFVKLRQTALEYLNTREYVYVIDSFAGWDTEHRIKVRIICSRPYHALFMHNMLIRPTPEQLASYGEPDYVIYNAGSHNAPKFEPNNDSQTSVALSFERREFVILGTDYAGEMKKGVFTIMNYLLPKKNALSMHCSVNVGKQGDVSLFCGLSGTGKTTLSADPRRDLVGDDEHYWTDEGLFNIEGGCYAKCDNLSAEKEPEIFNAIKFGALLENVVINEKTRQVDYNDLSITENTRCSYPIEAISNAKVPCQTGHAKNIVFLTADASGVFPPVSKLSVEQAMFFFVNGYTAKVAGTEVGVTEPKATFSACYGAPFMVWHPSKYAELLAQKIKKHGCSVWLVNTGWTGGKYGQGHRISLKHTRAILDAIHDGSLNEAPFETADAFKLQIPKAVNNVPSEILDPKKTWANKDEYLQAMQKLENLFAENNKKYLV